MNHPTWCHAASCTASLYGGAHRNIATTAGDPPHSRLRLTAANGAEPRAHVTLLPMGGLDARQVRELAGELLDLAKQMARP